MNAHARRCILFYIDDVIVAGRKKVQMEKPSVDNDASGGPTCWICLEGGVDASGGALR